MGRHFGQACVPEEGSGLCPIFAKYMRLKLRKNYENKTSGRIADKCLAVNLAARPLGCLDWAAIAVSSFACTSGESGQPWVSASICRVAELRAFPHQLTLSRNSRLGLCCGRRRTELPNPRKFTCYYAYQPVGSPHISQ